MGLINVCSIYHNEYHHCRKCGTYLGDSLEQPSALRIIPSRTEPSTGPYEYPISKSSSKVIGNVRDLKEGNNK